MLHRLITATALSVSLLFAAHGPVSAAPGSQGSLIALGENLKVEVTETGPDQLWTLHLSNLGAFPIGLIADPGLLWFQVDVPGKAPQTCRLPEPLWPKTMRRRAQMVLEPGERFSRRFDPRFFCFSDVVQSVLVPGARVSPHFGWPHETQVVRVKGVRTTRNLPPAAPFVAWALEPEVQPEADGAEPQSPGTDPAEAPEVAAEEAPWAAPTEGVKHVAGAAIVLSPAYGKWSQPVERLAPGLHAAMLAGSDAEDERSVTATVAVVNTSPTAQQLFVRRELIRYLVIGPDGTFHCPTADIGPPDIASFSTLAPRGTERFAVRLIEMCPRGSFSRPGLYEVHATVDAKYSGQAMNIDAFVGTLEAPRPALIRVRSGDRSSILRAAPMLAGGNAMGGITNSAVAPPGNAEGGAPVDGAQEAPPAEELPPDHGGPAAPGEAPAPEPPAEPPVTE